MTSSNRDQLPVARAFETAESATEREHRGPIEVSGPDRSGQNAGIMAAPLAIATNPSSVLDDLLASPFEFDFDAAIAILRKDAMRAGRSATIKFEAAVGLVFASSDVLRVERRSDHDVRLVAGFLGLTGPGGVLPRIYTEHVTAERRRRSSALGDFLDMLAQRPMTQFAAAAMKHRPHRLREEAILDERQDDHLRSTLVALTGHAIPVVADAVERVQDAVLHHAGAFSAFPRSAERLASLLSDVFDRPVTVLQFAGRWNRLDPGERTRMPRRGVVGGFHRIGIDAVVGAAFWDIQCRIVIRVGPLSLDDFETFLPGGSGLAELATLAQAYLDDVVEFAVNPVLAALAVPPLELSGDAVAAARLGRNTWLTRGSPRQRDATDVLVIAEQRQSI